MPPLWVHFYGVGVSALVAGGCRRAHDRRRARSDARTVVVGGGFTIMATLLAVHGLVTPGVLVGKNGVIALTGAATLPVGAAVLALSGPRGSRAATSIPRDRAGGVLCAVDPRASAWSACSCRASSRPCRRRARRRPGSARDRPLLFAALAVRAANTSS